MSVKGRAAVTIGFGSRIPTPHKNNKMRTKAQKELYPKKEGAWCYSGTTLVYRNKNAHPTPKEAV